MGSCRGSRRVPLRDLRKKPSRDPLCCILEDRLSVPSKKRFFRRTASAGDREASTGSYGVVVACFW